MDHRAKDPNAVATMAWDAVGRRLAAGALAILPIGAGAKEHGWHLPMATDAIQAEWLSARLAARFDALVWPVLSYGHYPAFVDYAGSASLSAETFERVVAELIAGIARSGARTVLLLDTGISTIAPVDRAIAAVGGTALHLKAHDGLRYRACAATATQAHGGHADELETSRLLALAPHLVAMDRAAASPETPPGPGPMQHRDPSAANYSASGSIGDPRAATPERGWALLEAMVADMIETIESALGTPSG